MTSKTNIELYAAQQRLNIMIAELTAMEEEVDDQMKKYDGWPGWDTDLICEIERGDIKTAALMGEDVKGHVMRQFESMGKEILKKQEEVDKARRVVMTYDSDVQQEARDEGGLVLWHHKGLHYLRNKNNHVWWQKTGRWVGVYVEADDIIDVDVTEPDYEDTPPPLVAVEYVTWTCDKSQKCLC